VGLSLLSQDLSGAHFLGLATLLGKALTENNSFERRDLKPFPVVPKVSRAGFGKIGSWTASDGMFSWVKMPK